MFGRDDVPLPSKVPKTQAVQLFFSVLQVGSRVGSGTHSLHDWLVTIGRQTASASIPTHIRLGFGLVEILLNVAHLLALLQQRFCSPARLVCEWDVKVAIIVARLF